MFVDGGLSNFNGPSLALLRLARTDPEALAEVFSNSRHPEVRLIAGNLQIKADSTLGGILSFAQEGIDFMRVPALEAAVAQTSFNLDGIVRGEPITIYIVFPPHMLNSHGRLLRLWISAPMSLIARRRNRPEKSTLFILDEAAQLGPLDELCTAITLMRGYGLQTWTFWQNVSQLRILYLSDWQTMLNNCAVLQALGPNNLRAAEELAAVFGSLNGHELLSLQADEVLLQIAGDEAVVAVRPKDLRDPAFKGFSDENPFFRRCVDPRPRPLIDRTYLRPVSADAQQSRAPDIGPKAANAITRILARQILRETADDAM